MRKLYSSLFLMLMLVIAIPPSMNVHFCGGRFASVSMWTKDAGCSCGKMNLSNIAKQSKLGDELASTSCCHVSQIGLAVDNYQIQTHDLQLNANTFHCLALVSTILFDFIPTSRNISVPSSAPPDHFAGRDLDILSFNCIYRI